MKLLPTVAEDSGFTDTANEAQVESYMRKLAGVWQQAELTTIGNTNEGRPIWAIVVAPQVVGNTKPVTVLMLGGIHSGECDGKEALLALARDMAAGKHGDWWHSLRLVFVPNFNADGNERRGRAHRPGQAGPDKGMGIRENAQGLDLNRDFVKLDSPEVRGLVAALNGFDVDVLIDTHTTNGSLHGYQLTYDIPHNPASPASVRHWLRSKLVPTVTRRMKQEGFDTYYYGNFDRDHQKWSTYGHEPRYSTEYMGMRGRIGILSESYSYVSYKTRVEVSYAFVTETLRVLAQEETEVRQMLDQAGESVVPGQKLPLQAEIIKTADGVTAKGFQTSDGTPPRGQYGAEALAAHEPKDYTVELWNRAQPTKEVKLPYAYAVPQEYSWAMSRLVRHGVQIQQLRDDTSAQVETYRISSLENQADFQRHDMLKLESEAERKEITLKQGSYIVQTQQPLGVLGGYMLEPMADDSLAVWNFFDPDLDAGDQFPVIRITQPLPEEALRQLDSIRPTEEISLEHLYAPEKTVSYGGASIRGANWLKNSSEYVIAKGNRSYAVDAETGSMRRLSELDSLRSKLAELDAFDQTTASQAARINVFTDDWRFALVNHKNDLYFFDAEKDVVRQLTSSKDAPERLAELSPTGKHVAFVQDNDLYVVDCETAKLTRLTDNGSEEQLNGILDWVYQEELYGRGNFKAFWWSPDGESICFLRLDQTPVPHYSVSDSISYGQTLESTRYPKAGEPLPKVDVWLADVSDGSIREVDLSNFPADDRLIGRVTWSPAQEVWLQVFNRVQNQQNLVKVPANSSRGQVLLSETSPGWIEIRGVPHFLPSGDFLWLSDLPDGRTHLYKVSSETGQRIQLTEGDWDVQSFLSVSKDNKFAFVTGNISHPIESQLISVNLENGELQQLTLSPGTHRPKVNASGDYFIDVFSNTTSQPFASVNRINGEMLRLIEAPISDRHDFVNVAAPETFTIRARDGLDLQSQLMLPPGFDKDKPDAKLPVVFFVYGGPQAPTVNNSWGGRNYWWHQMLCQQGFAVVLCDNRSARGRGVKDTWTIRGDMCRVELQDLEDAVSWVSEQPWADSERFGMWGWSYGGYFTSYALTHSKVFNCGIAGAPVTDWRNYDAIYTERYMDLPQDNEEGYKSSSSVEAAENLHGHLLIIHGERDDNVHMSNSLQLAYALQKAGKQFELMIYPKNRHGIVDPAQSFHLYTMMTDFFKKHLID